MENLCMKNAGQMNKIDDYMETIKFCMQEKDRASILESIKVCGQRKDLQKGVEIHSDILKKRLYHKDIFMTNALMGMYIKCNGFAKARKVFDELTIRTVVSWNVLITGYAKDRLVDEALNCFKQMQEQCIFPDAYTVTCILKSCGSMGLVKKGKEIHVVLYKEGSLENNVVIGTALMDMYVKCGMVLKALEVFDELPEKNIISWNALIAGYSQHGLGNEALRYFKMMQEEGLSPDVITYTCILKACGSTGASRQGEELYAKISKQGLLKENIMLGSALVDMYSKCNMTTKAREVFDELPVQDVVMWTALIDGYAQQGLGVEALNCFKEMKDKGFSPDATTFTCILKACGSLGSVAKAEEVHAEIRKLGLVKKNTVVGNALVDMYIKCGLIQKAKEVFDELAIRDAISWNILIGGYVQYGLADEALDCFSKMQQEGIPPDGVTFTCILKACSSISALDKGEEIHAEIDTKGLLEKNIVLGNAVVDMYVKCGALAKAENTFNTLLVRDVISWNALIAGYAQHGLNDEVFGCFKKMHEEGLTPDAVTFVCIMKACGSLGSSEKAEEIHAEVRNHALLGKNIMICNALVDMHAKCGSLAKAREVFDDLPVRDIFSWNALISGYVKHGLDAESLRCFAKMKEESISPDGVTFVCILKACSSMGSMEKGEDVHVEMGKQGFLERDIMVGSALVDMYAKFGAIEKAQRVFNELHVRDVVAWSALIAGYSQLGQIKRVFSMFDQMITEGIVPTLVTFIALLTACSHTGLVDEGQVLFTAMSTIYSLTPTHDHYTCMVDLFSRAGHFDKAVILIENVECSDRLPLWITLLGSCKKWVNVALGQHAFEKSIELDAECVTAYLCMSNIYAAAGMRREENRAEKLMMKFGA